MALFHDAELDPANSPQILEIRPLTGVMGRLALSRGKASPAKVLEAGAALDLLRKHHRLDPVEEALEPANELGVSDSQLSV